MKSALDELAPKPSHPSETGSGTPSRQTPPAPSESIDTHEVSEHLRPSTGPHPFGGDDNDGI